MNSRRLMGSLSPKATLYHDRHWNAVLCVTAKLARECRYGSKADGVALGDSSVHVRFTSNSDRKFKLQAWVARGMRGGVHRTQRAEVRVHRRICTQCC